MQILKKIFDAIMTFVKKIVCKVKRHIRRGKLKQEISAISKRIDDNLQERRAKEADARLENKIYTRDTKILMAMTLWLVTDQLNCNRDGRRLLKSI